MNRFSLGALAVALLAGLAVWMAGSRPAAVRDVAPPAAPVPSKTPAGGERPDETRRATPGAVSTTVAPSSSQPADDEASFMNRLRRADPATMLALCRDGNRRYPGSAAAEEREARAVDALVALDDIGEAHTEAMLFVQHHPSGPFTAHIANLMGVHPRPPGAVPEPALESDRR